MLDESKKKINSQFLTLSKPVCTQGNEKVKPSGKDASCNWCLVKKSSMLIAMWSKSCREKYKL